MRIPPERRILWTAVLLLCAIAIAVSIRRLVALANPSATSPSPLAGLDALFAAKAGPLWVGRRRSAVMVIVVTLSICRVAAAHVRGVYPAGMSAINAGVTPTSGLTYSNLFIFNARDQSKDATGEVVEPGSIR